MMMNCKGNALVYVLIAVALMAAVTYAVTGDNRGSQEGQLTDAQAKLLATDLIAHAAAAEQAVYQMTQWGVDYSEIKFDLPSTAGYSTDVTKQIYHPSGGGLTFPTYNPDTIFVDNSLSPPNVDRGWRWQNITNVEWSSSSATDIIMAFVDINPNICAAINEQLVGNATVPTSGVNFNATFDYSYSSHDNFTISDCVACQNKRALCIENGTGQTYAFYSILGSR